MELSKELSSEVEIGASMAAFHNALESQKQLLHNQIDHLRTIVVTQCKLTGVNPLSQEMAAGALSINIGKRPRDLLNPKAVKYMQLVFSIKDAISKKESREISARFGLTVTQVREYFASQRTRVRKMVRLSREKAIIASASKEFQDVSTYCDPTPPPPIDPIPLNSVGPANTEEVSCSNPVDVLPGLSEFEKQFVENIFSSMCKEETFAGQVKLMEWILRIENPSVLTWFLNKGGAMMLASWLSQAATEEQTSVLSVVLKVLSHLPLHKAPPVYMPEMLQAINRLRFYGISDVSNRARVLLSKWSKMLSKSQASRKLNGVKSASASEIDLSQRIGELIEDESWKSSINNSDLILAPLGGEIDDSRKMEIPKLLMAPSDDSNKKNILSSSTTYNKERRKIRLVEQPGNKTAGKIQQGKAVPSGASQARPITADEIQKAKIRAQYSQNNKTKCEGAKKSSLLTTDFLSASEAYLRPKIEAQKKARLLAQRDTKQLDSSLLEQKPTFNEESLPEKCRRVQIPWRAPPEFQANSDWKIGVGQHSKEFESQRTRMLREKETTYRTHHDVPPNPKDPWDIEIDFDDTLTPDIPIDQLPDSDADADDVITPLDTQDSRNPNFSATTQNVQSNSCQANKGVSEAEPDLELLAVLLKNPDLVFALTSGQASGLSSEDTVRLLDVLKSSSGAGLVNLPSPTPVRNVEVSLPSPTPPTRYEVSLPSPTPSCNPGPSGWTSEAAKNPFSRNITAPLPLATATVIASDRFQSTNTLQSHTFLPSASTQTPPINHLSMSSLHSERHPTNVSTYYHSQQHFQAVSEPYIPVDDSNRSKLRGTHTMPESRAGQQRNEPFQRGQRGFESSSPQKYHGEQGNHRYGHGHEWNSQDQRGYYGHSSDSVGRYQKSSGYQDRSWRGGGGNRRYDDDRRR